MMAITPHDTLESKKKQILVSLTLLYLLIVFISAWLSDDSYITFRTIDNFINGHGLTWNVDERVQAYTHPLWIFILSPLCFMTREIYFTSIIFSIIISVGAVLLLLFKLSNSVVNSIIIGFILILSKAFIDYSTSGLENPLLHMLSVIFFIIYFGNETEKKLLFLSIIASLATLTRPDIILLFLPALVVAYLNGDKLKGILTIIMGFLPFILWELFSLFYYGFPFPNTAYAKLNTGIPQDELMLQGLYYFLNSFLLDPVTPIIIIAALIFPIITKKKNLLPLSIGIVLYLFYIIIIGGDFMGGRFFTTPLICSTIIISTVNFKSLPVAISSIVAVLILGFLSPKPTILSNQYYGLGPKTVKALRFGPLIVNMYHGVVDERFWYYENTGLLNNIFETKIKSHPWAKDGIELKKRGNQVVVRKTIGLLGYYAGPGIHIIDPLALSDPLLSKIHSTEYWRIQKYRFNSTKKWRIGHFARKIPNGYIESIKAKDNLLEDKDLKEYYDKILSVIRGNLFDTERMIEIININLGKYDYLLDSYNSKLKDN
jgi:arabinofuranosyltransferase